MDKRKANLKYVARAIGLSMQIKSPLSILVSMLGLGAAFLPMLIALRLRIFTDYLHGLFNEPGLLNSTILAFAILILLYIAHTVFTLIQNYFTAQDTARIKQYIKQQTLELLSTVPYPYIESNKAFREKLDFVKQYAGQRAAGSVSLVFSWIAGLVTFVSVAFLLVQVSLWIVIALVATCIPAVILSILQKDETYYERTKMMKEGRLTMYYSDILRSQWYRKEIRFFGLYQWIRTKWLAFADIWMTKKHQITRKHLIYNTVADLLRNGVFLVVLLLTAWEIYSEPAQGLGVFMLVITAASQLQNVTTNLLVNATSIFSDAKYMEDFFTILETKREISPSNNDASYDQVNIEFDKVNFSYPGSESLALDGLSVTIKQGEKVAIVGANGSGKSTFVNLICGLYAPQSGNVKINGDSILDNLWKVRRSLSIIFQYFCKYQDTLRNNIAISDPSRASDDASLLSLSEQTGANEVINAKDNALDEEIGLFSKSGLDLSGGQWQKIAITRALFRKQARVYILDEPTAALDPIAEANIYRNFAALTEDKTTVLISHRLGITSVVDRILVFDKGKIVEDGNHADLIQRGGLYAKMYEAQAQWYVA